jgi:hypothetical protein
LVGGSSGKLLSEATSEFSDGSYALYVLYNEKSAEFDKQLASSWSEHVRDLMVLVRYTSPHLVERPFVLTRLLIDRVAFSRRQFPHSSLSLT